jgi:hypothetical protein
MESDNSVKISLHISEILFENLEKASLKVLIPAEKLLQIFIENGTSLVLSEHIAQKSLADLISPKAEVFSKPEIN